MHAVREPCLTVYSLHGLVFPVLGCGGSDVKSKAALRSKEVSPSVLLSPTKNPQEDNNIDCEGMTSSPLAKTL